MAIKHLRKSKFITPAQWAASHLNKWGRPFTNAGVSKRIRKGHYLEDVISIKNAGRFYLLEVPDDLDVEVSD